VREKAWAEKEGSEQPQLEEGLRNVFSKTSMQGKREGEDEL